MCLLILRRFSGPVCSFTFVSCPAKLLRLSDSFHSSFPSVQTEALDLCSQTVTLPAHKMPACPIPEPGAGVCLVSILFISSAGTTSTNRLHPKCHVQAECSIRPNADVSMLGSSTLTVMEMEIGREVSPDHNINKRKISAAYVTEKHK